MTPTEIILHHSATKDSGTVSWNAIRRYHVNECVWGDIGYHFGIELTPDKGYAPGSYEILMGRMPDVPGAHTKDHNQTSLGVCFVGAFDSEPVPAMQWEKGLALVRWLCRNWGIPVARVFGHREFANKTCPGLLFDLDRFRCELKL
jgi:hypothetical protein